MVRGLLVLLLAAWAQSAGGASHTGQLQLSLEAWGETPLAPQEPLRGVLNGSASPGTGCSNCFCLLEDAIRCGTEAITDAVRCGTETLADAARCGTESVTEAARCGEQTITDAARCGTDRITEAARCGEDRITDAARCGKDTISDGARCGWDRVQDACGWHRRRDLGELRCNFKDIAKSCDIPRSCNIARTCDVARTCKVAHTCTVGKTCAVPMTCNIAKRCNLAQSFGECLDSLSSTMGAAEKEFMKFVSSTGCTSAAACKAKVLAGLEASYSFIRTGTQNQIKALTTSITGNVATGTAQLNTAMATASRECNTIIAQANGIVAKVLGYLTRTLSGFEKFPIGEVCSGEGTGVWYMMPTDCGAFDAMQNLFTSLEAAPQHFTATLNSFKTCVAKTGVWGTPTPFLDLKTERWCLPQPIVTGMEYLLGGIIYASNVVATLVADIRTVQQTVVAWLRTNLKLDTLGAAALQQLGTSSNTTSLEETGTGCGSNAGWAVQSGMSFSVTFPAPSGDLSLSMGLSVVLGCKGGARLPPNWILSFGFSRNLNPADQADKPEPSLSGSFLLAFSLVYPTFTNRASFSAGLCVVPNLDLKDIIGVPVNVGVPWFFDVRADPRQPPTYFATGWSLKNSEAKPALAELDSRVNEASKVAGRAALMRRASSEGLASNEDYAAGTLAATAAAFGTMAEGLQEGLANSEAPSSEEVLKETRAAQQAAPAAQQIHRSGTGVGVSATMGVSFCITPARCFGN